MMKEDSADDDMTFYEDNGLVAEYAQLLSSQRDRYLLQASEIMRDGQLELAKDNCVYRYSLSENMFTFHIERIHKNTSTSTKMPVPIEHEARLEKLISAFAQSEAVAKA